MSILWLLVPFLSLAHIIQDDVAIKDKSRHSLKYVCSKSGHPDAPLIEIASNREIDCMGKKIEVGGFCEKELATDPYYLRAYIDRAKQEVVCVSGKKVLFKYLCVKLSDRKLCSSKPESSCRYIQNKLAKRLDLVHSSIVSNDKGIKQLNCFFESLPVGHGL
jgi:hypothetical protein